MPNTPLMEAQSILLMEAQSILLMEAAAAALSVGKVRTHP